MRRSPSRVLRARMLPRLVCLALAGLLASTSAACKDSVAPEEQAMDQLLFLSTRDGAMRGSQPLNEIYRMNADGSGLENLTRHPGSYTHLSVLPGGRTVIFEGTRDWGPFTTDCPTQIWRMETDGSRLQPVTAGNCSRTPHLSLDGSSIAYRHGDAIFVANIDGTGAREVSHALPPVEHSCSEAGARWFVQILGWVPAGRVAFYRHICGVGTTNYSVDAQGNGLSELDHGSQSGYPSPDGKRVAFTSAGQLLVMNADGSHVRGEAQGAALPDRLVNGVSPWSPDGTRLYFTTVDGHYVADVAGTGVRRLAEASFIATYYGWSPRGDRIAFHALTGEAGTDIYVVGVDGGGPVKLTNGGSFNTGAVWVRGR